MATAPNKRHHLRLIRPGEDGYPARRERPIHPVLLWFGVLGGPVAFGVVHLVGSFVLTGRCVHPAVGSTLLGLAPSQQLMALITIGAAVIAGAAGIASWYGWRQTRRQADEDSGESVRSTPFWALGGLFLSSVFFVLILLTGALAVGLSSPCIS